MRLSLLALLNVLLFGCCLAFGSVHIPLADIPSLLASALSGDAVPTPESVILLHSRLPQALTAMLAGAMLGTAGLLLQTAFRNPLAGPDILGVNAGAGLGVAVVMLLCGGSVALGTYHAGGMAAVMAAAFAGAAAVMAALIGLSSLLRNSLMLLIAGIMTGYLASSVIMILNSLSNADAVRSYVVWGMGTFGNVPLGRLPVLAVPAAVGLLSAWLLSKPLDLMQLGSRYAANLGLNIRRTRHMLLGVTGLLAAAVTALCGPVSFLGLAVPHLARLWMRTASHRTLLPAVMLCGSAAALGCTLLASVLPSSGVLPLNAVTPLVGVPVILYILIRRR